MTMTYEAKFLYAVTQTLNHEGGYSNHEWDPGGETKFGITKATASRHGYDNVADLTLHDVIDIYYQGYWQADNLNEIDHWAIAGKLFDLGVNTGPSNRTQMIQAALIRIFGHNLKHDGIMGPVTLSAINKECYQYPEALMMSLLVEAVKYYNELDINLIKKAIKGWYKRLLPQMPYICQDDWYELSQSNNVIEQLQERLYG